MLTEEGVMGISDPLTPVAGFYSQTLLGSDRRSLAPIREESSLPEITRNPSSAFTSVRPKKTPRAFIMKKQRYNSRYPLPEKPRQRRAVIQDMVRPLKQWLVRHRHNPYPTKTEKVQLALGSNMTLVQVSNWFANARRRLKNVVQDSRSTWSKRLRMYNQFVQGNAELLSISSDDSIWNSDDEDDRVVDLREASSSSSPEVDSCGRTTASTRGGEEEEEPFPPSLPKDGGNTKYKTSILHRYLADSIDANARPTNLPIRPIPTRVGKSERLYRPYYKKGGGERKEESEEEERKDPSGILPLHPPYPLPTSFHYWPHFHPFFPPLITTAQQELLRLMYKEEPPKEPQQLASSPYGGSSPEILPLQPSLPLNNE